MCFFCPTLMRIRDIRRRTNGPCTGVFVCMMFFICKYGQWPPLPTTVQSHGVREEFQSLSLIEDPWKMEHCFQGSLGPSIFWILWMDLLFHQVTLLICVWDIAVFERWLFNMEEVCFWEKYFFFFYKTAFMFYFTSLEMRYSSLMPGGFACGHLWNDSY